MDIQVEHGLIVLGDVAFATAAARQQSGAEVWDEDEFYWAADETASACAETNLDVTFQQISWCTGVFVVKPATFKMFQSIMPGQAAPVIRPDETDEGKFPCA